MLVRGYVYSREQEGGCLGIGRELVLQYGNGHHGGCKRGQEETEDGGHGGDLAVDPQHGGGDVSDDGPGAARIGFGERGRGGKGG